MANTIIIKEGDILCGTHGWSMRIPHFYRVIKVTEKRLKVVRLASRMVQATDGGYNQQGYEMPVNACHSLDAKTEIARPYKGEWLIGSRYDTMRCTLWDGQPIWADYCD